jgi:NAD+ diphosphatase
MARGVPQYHSSVLEVPFMPDVIPFSGNPLDRAARERRDPIWLEQKRTDRTSRFLPLWRLQIPTTGGDNPVLVWANPAQMARLEYEPPTFLLGHRDGEAYFAADVSALSDPAEALSLESARYADARGLAVRLPAEEAGIVAQAKANIDWHATHRFCPNCGDPTESRDAGIMRKCEACGTEHFPRTNPVVIMVVWRGDRCLLGRGATWAPNSYSALAGFVDQGESLEEAVAREVKEEVNLAVDQVRYIASQPWPFPMSLMLGCFARVTGETFEVDPFELAEARWFERSELQQALAGPNPAMGFSVPGRLAIAHHIIKAWVEGARD